jgi:hypothetical protein
MMLARLVRYEFMSGAVVLDALATRQVFRNSSLLTDNCQLWRSLPRAKPTNHLALIPAENAG